MELSILGHSEMEFQLVVESDHFRFSKGVEHVTRTGKTYFLDCTIGDFYFNANRGEISKIGGVQIDLDEAQAERLEGRLNQITEPAVTKK